MAQKCLFCSIAQGSLVSDILYRDEQVFVIRDINPRAPVHLLIIPVRHFVYPDDLSESTEPLLGHLYTVARETAQREGIAESGYRVAMNRGDDAGQTVAHLHLHLLGGHRLGPEG